MLLDHLLAEENWGGILHYNFLFVSVNQARWVCLTTPTQSTFFGIFLQVFRPAGQPQRVDYLAQMENRRKVFPQGYNDAMLVRESNQE